MFEVLNQKLNSRNIFITKIIRLRDLKRKFYEAFNTPHQQDKFLMLQSFT